MSFFSLRRPPPRVSTTFFPEINAGPVEAATKTVITQNAANSWVITAYFIRCARGSRQKRQHLYSDKFIKYGRTGGCSSARRSVHSASPVRERGKIG